MNLGTYEEQKAAVLAAEVARIAAHLDAQLTLPAAGRAWVLSAFGGEPARAVRGGRTNMTSRFAPLGAKLTQSTESRSLEYAYQVLLHADPDVVGSRAQPRRILVRPYSVEPDGTRVKRGQYRITPDVLEVRRDRVVLTQLSLDETLQRESKRRPWYYVQRPDGTWRCPALEEAAAELGFEAQVIVRSQLNQVAVRNAEYLGDFRGIELPASAAEAIVGRVSARPGETVRELLEAASVDRPVLFTADELLAAIATELVFVNQGRDPVDDHAHCRVYPDGETAAAWEERHPPSWALGSHRPATISLLPGASVLCEGTPMQVLSSNSDGLSLLPLVAGAGPIRIAASAVETMVQGGALRGDPAAESDVARAIRERWDRASRGARDIAAQRYAALQVWLANRERPPAERMPLPLVYGMGPDGEPGVPGDRSLYRWHAASRESDRALGDPLLGLLPEPRVGRPRFDLEPEVIEIIERQIDDYYAQPKRPYKSALYHKVRGECRAAGLQPPDRKSIRRLLGLRDQYHLRRSREGTRGAYDDKPYLPIDPDASPTHGLHPFHRVHWDVTLIDNESVDEETGLLLGRPSQGRLVDGYDGTTLSWVWFYGPEKGEYLIEALARCAERHGRLMNELIVDRGMANKLKRAMQLLATQHVSVTWRLTGEGRFGNPVERTFGAANTRLWHLMVGNTQATKTGRKVTPQVEPRRQAVLTLREYDEVYRQYVEKVEAETVVPRLGLTVREAHERGVAMHGVRERRFVDPEAFRALIRPSAGSPKCHRLNGVSVKYLYYWHDCFGHQGVAGMRLDTDLVIGDVSRVVTFVPAHRHGVELIPARWVTAFCRRLAGRRVFSHAELAFVTTELRQRLRVAGQRQAVLEDKLVELLDVIDEIEGAAILRARAIAVSSTAEPARATTPARVSPPLAVPEQVGPLTKRMRAHAAAGREDPTAAESRKSAESTVADLPAHERRYWNQYATPIEGEAS